MIYPPQEDSLLLEKFVKKYACGSVLDLGTGSGIQALAASGKRSVSRVIAADVNPEAVRHCRILKNRKITCRKSDLFSNIRKKFDTIIFNPPYLPQERAEREIALEGGKKGYEIIERFLAGVNAHLKTGGIVLLLFSSLTDRQKVEELVQRNLLEFKELGRKHIFFEDLFVYLIKKSALLKNIEKKGIKDIRYFAKGKRGLVFTGKYRNKKVAVKVRHPKSRAVGRIRNEARALKKVNKLKIGPKLVAANSFVAYEFVPGEYLGDWLPKASKKKIKNIMKQLFEKAFKLDRAGLAKEEMLRPLKNAVVRGGKVVLIDFERTHKSKKPKNVTQLCQFVQSRRGVLRKKGFDIDFRKLRHSAKHYKQHASKGNLGLILETAGFK